MSFTFTAEQIEAIQIELGFIDILLAQDPDASAPYVDAYNMVFGMITDINTVTGEQTPKAGIDTDIERAAWVFIRGVSFVNANDTDNHFNNFIRTYSKIQYETRFGVEATDTKIQNASNAIARAILESIIDFQKLPDIHSIATDDAEGAAKEIFSQAEIAGWAGNPMLIPVGHISSFQQNILHQKGGDPLDTYDLLSVAYSMMKAADIIGIPATFANIWNVAFDIYATTNSTSGWADYLETIWNDDNISTILLQSETMLQNAYGGAISLSDVPGYLSSWDDIYLGTKNNDLMDVGDWADDDIIHAGDGDDTIAGSQGDDLIDGGSGNDWVDYTGFDALWNNDVYVDLTKNISITEYLALSDADYLYNIENIRTGSGNDTLIGGEITHVLDAGAGDDVLAIFGNAVDATLYGGAGEDIILGGNGSIVYGGEGADTFQIGQQYLVADASTDDRLQSIGGKTLTGGIRWENSESLWAYGTDGTKYAVNVAGELVVQGVIGKETYVAGFNNSVSGPYTAGIGLGEANLEIYRLLETPNGWQLYETFEALMGYALKILTGESHFATVDPLVLDLDGDGIELTARSSVAPFFDVDGDGFAEQTGWVQPDDAFLVRDLNGNGTIDNISEMFGDVNTSGFAALNELDSNNDSIINAADVAFTDLRLWRDADGDGVTDAGELLTLAEAEVASIGLSHNSSSTQIAGNNILATGTFTRTDGSTGTIGDIGFAANQKNTHWLGDKTVSTSAKALPNVAGKGTLTDLHIAMTDNGALLTAVQNALPLLNTLNLEEMRTAIRPILTEWMETVDVSPGTPGTIARNDVLMLVGTTLNEGASVYDFAYVETDEQGSYLKLASGEDILDTNGQVIARPQAADVLAQTTSGGQEWTVLTGAEIQFLERYSGNAFPIGIEGSATSTSAINAIGSVLDYAFNTLNEIAVRIAMQGPLAEYFAGIAYDVTKDTFHATSDKQIVPMLEAIFEDAPGTPSGDETWLAQWKPVLDVFLQDFTRGEAYLKLSYGFLFQNLVAAYENVGLAVSLTQTAGALDIPQDIVQTGAGLLTGTEDADLFYLGAENQTLEGGLGPDTYVVGQHFGNDVINDVEEASASPRPDMLRFAQHNVDELSFAREGNDLIITVNGASDTLRLVNQFNDARNAPFAGSIDPDYGVREIIFADGSVWDKLDIAHEVSQFTTGDDSIIGTNAIDFLEGGTGNDTLEGGRNGDIYRFGEGYGQDVIYDVLDYIYVDAPDIIEFKEGISLDDLIFTREGNSDDLIISIKDTTDTLTVKKQFDFSETGAFGLFWFYRIEGFYTADGESLAWDDIFDKILNQLHTDGDDTIYGFAREDVLQGGKGNDFLSGGEYGDTYIFNAGDGQDTIHDIRTNILMHGEDKLKFGEGITAEDTIFTRIGNTHDLQITFTNSTDSILI